MEVLGQGGALVLVLVKKNGRKGNEVRTAWLGQASARLMKPGNAKRPNAFILTPSCLRRVMSL